MNKGVRRWLWLILAIALILGLVWQFFPLSDASARFDKLPLYGKSFKGRNLPLSSLEQEWFKNVNLLKRLYDVGGQNVFISALDGTRNRHLVHDPLYCLRGGGWELISQEQVALPHGKAVLLWLKNDKDEQQQAMYWFTDGTEQYDSPLRYWLEATLRRLTFGRSGAEPVLVIVQPVGTSKLDWRSLFEQFPELLQL